MIQKYTYGSPFQTDAVIEEIPATKAELQFGKVTIKKDGFTFFYNLGIEDLVYGLGEAIRGINKRGYCYESFCTDIPEHTEDQHALYGAHNFLLVDGEETFGLFFDYPGKMHFDVGFEKRDVLRIFCKSADLDLYVITGESPRDIVKQFRRIIGKSYLPPKFAFGYGQSRWGYKTAEDFRKVVQKHREALVPLDLVYMDIDYMDHYKDFTVNTKEFPDFKAFVEEMKQQQIHLVPIIDAGIKIEDGYRVYEEGKEKGYFCKREDGSDFEAAVWPGLTHFPDVLNKEARAWFGENYKVLLDAGIDAFWNDMNEPAIFYSPEGVAKFRDFYETEMKDKKEVPGFELRNRADGLANSDADYGRFYHNVDGTMVCHEKVHNLFGYQMTRAASEAFQKLCPEKEILLFSRASYIGMHRYGGVWTGDNRSWWSHLLLNLKMLPSLNMCGFLYTGADLGGFGSDTSRDLLLRWLALGVFTPLMRNHSCAGTREQEVYQFEDIEDFRQIISVRYRLLPYLYDAFQKAVKEDDMLFRPLAFDYPKDQRAKRIEDQLLLSDELMIAPVYEQNATGRFVYLPEEMMLVKFLVDGTICTEVLAEGNQYIDVDLNEVAFFIRRGYRIPVVKAAQSVEQIEEESAVLVGYLP